MSYQVAKVEPEHRFIHIAFHFRPFAPSAELLAGFNLAKDWYRYAPNCWIVWTAGTPQSWFNYLRSHMAPEDYVFIIEIRGPYAGWLPAGAWEWMQRTRPEPHGPPLDD